jgi:hypothetical protein
MISRTPDHDRLGVQVVLAALHTSSVRAFARISVSRCGIIITRALRPSFLRACNHRAHVSDRLL